MKNSYKTEQRRIILGYLTENKEKFVDVNEIMNYMKKHNQGVGQTTIYRFLNSLENQNLVRTEIRNHTKYYQYISDECTKHFHLK